MKNIINPSQLIPFVGVTLCSATAVLLTVEADSIGRTGMVALCLGVYLVICFVTDFVLSLPEKYKTPWPALLTWSALMVGLTQFLPTFL